MKHLTKEQIEQIKELRREIGALNNRQSVIESKISKLLPSLNENISEITEADNQKPIDKMLTLKIFENCIYNELDKTDIVLHKHFIEISTRLLAIDGLLVNIEARSKKC